MDGFIIFIGLIAFLCTSFPALLFLWRANSGPGRNYARYLMGVLLVALGVTLVGVSWAAVLRLDAKPYEAVEARYGVSVDAVPQGDFDRPGDWKLDGAWRRCYIDYTSKAPEAVRLFCGGPQGKFVEQEPVR